MLIYFIIYFDNALLLAYKKYLNNYTFYKAGFFIRAVLISREKSILSFSFVSLFFLKKSDKRGNGNKIIEFEIICNGYELNHKGLLL